MSETNLTKEIKVALYKYTKCHLAGIYGAFEVVMGANTIGYGNEKVDFLTMDSDSKFRCYEIKVSKEDLHSGAQLSFYGDFNYLVVPDESLVPGVRDAAIKLVLSTYRYKTGILVYHGCNVISRHSGEKELRYSFTLDYVPKRQKIRIEQRIANMYNMVRSGSRYATKWVKEEEKGFLQENELHSMPEISDDDFLAIFGHTKDYV